MCNIIRFLAIYKYLLPLKLYGNICVLLGAVQMMPLPPCVSDRTFQWPLTVLRSLINWPQMIYYGKKYSINIRFTYSMTDYEQGRYWFTYNKLSVCALWLNQLQVNQLRQLWVCLQVKVILWPKAVEAIWQTDR